MIDKINATEQALIIRRCPEKDANADLKVWSVTADGTGTNIRTIELLGCNVSGRYENIKSSFAHPITGKKYIPY